MRHAQCFLRLMPYIACDKHSYWVIFGIAVATFCLETIAFPVLAWQALQRQLPYFEFLQAAVREDWPLRSLWAGPVAFGRKLTIVAVVTCARRTDYQQTLPVLFASIFLIMILLQARARASPATLCLCVRVAQ
jgi:hypothetical protein